MYYLYIKTHNKTGLKYLGKTNAKNPFEYKGSGKYWLSHVNKYGYDVTTKILLATESKEEIKETGLFFSKLFNIVKSKEWANLQEEKGDGVSSQFASEENFRRLEKGTHPFCDTEHNKRTNSKRQETKRKNGTHNFLGGEIQRKRVKEGTHHWLSGNLQRNHMKKIVSEGRHNMQQGMIIVVDRFGIKQQIPKEIFLLQDDLVHVNTIEGKRRLGKSLEKTERQKEYYKMKISCPHCKKEGNISNMKRWHFENCKYLKETQE